MQKYVIKKTLENHSETLGIYDDIMACSLWSRSVYTLNEYLRNVIIIMVCCFFSNKFIKKLSLKNRV